MLEQEEFKPDSEEETLNPNEENESDSSKDLESLFDDEESSSKEEQARNFLAVFNKMAGKNYKSLEALVKSQKEADKFFAERGNKPKVDEKKEEPMKEEVKIPKVVEILYFNSHPEAKLVWDEVVKASKLTGRDPFELYEEEKFFQEKAQALYEEKEAKENDKSKVKSPSFAPGGKGATSSKISLSDADRALLRAAGLTEKDVKV